MGAVELYLAQAINLGAVPWLIGVAGLALFSSIGIWTVELQASAEPENAELMAYLKPYRRAGNRYNVSGTVLLVVLALAGALGGCSAADARLGMPGVAEVGAAMLTGLWVGRVHAAPFLLLAARRGPRQGGASAGQA